MPARIETIETCIVDLPTIRPHKLAMATLSIQSCVIVRLRCSDGIEGIGEAATIGGLSYGEESPEGMQLAIERYLAPLLIGQPTFAIQSAKARMHHHVKGNYFAKNALETALLDAQGKRLGVPISTLLGGTVTTHLPVLWVLASGNTDTDIAEAKQMITLKRHKDFKLKIGSRPVKDDIAHVAAIKSALVEYGSQIRVDVNQAWDEATAIIGMRGLEDAGIDLVEQPVKAHQLDVLARLNARFDIPILADESVATASHGYTLARSACARAYALKIAKAGGPLGVLELAHVAQAAGIGLYGGTMLEGSIATAAAIHTFAVLPQLEWGTELFSPLLLKDDIVEAGLNYTHFGVDVPSQPGLGIHLDDDKLNFYRRK